MDELLSHISIPAALVAALSSLVIGFIWYHPKVFGTSWMRSLGKTEDDLSGGNMAVIFGVTFIVAALLAYFLQATIEFSHWHPDMGDGKGVTHSDHTFKHGALHGAIYGFFMIMPVIVIKALFERFNFKYMLIHIGYWMLVFAVMGGITDAWI